METLLGTWSLVKAPQGPRLEGRADHAQAAYRAWGTLLEPKKEGGDGRPQAKGPARSLELGLSCLLPASQRKRDGELRARRGSGAS